MIIPRGFYYEGQLPELGDKAYFTIGYLPKRTLQKLPTLLREGEWARLDNFFVHPKLRKRGVGKRLLRLVIAWQTLTRTNLMFTAAPYKKGSGCSSDVLHKFYSQNGFPNLPNTAYHHRRWYSYG